MRDIVIRSTAAATGSVAGPTREDAENRLFADLDPATKAWALERYTRTRSAVYEQPIKLDNFWSHAVEGERHLVHAAQNPGEAHQRRTAEKLGANGPSSTPAITRC